MVAAAQEKYVNDRSYNSARNSGTVIAWNPEGYRDVKHVLVKFSDDQAARYRELHNTLDSLNAEMEALDKPKATEAPAEAAKADDGKNASETASAEDAATQRAENSEAPEAEEATAETRTREQIQADLDRANAGLEALYEELMPKAQEVVVAFNSGIFHTSNKTLQQIFEICRRGVMLGTQEGYLDCPTIEKGQYLGDAIITSRSHLWLTGSSEMLKKCIDQFANTAMIDPGLMGVAPGGVMQEIADFSLLFSQLLLTWFDFTGDAGLLAKYEPICAGIIKETPHNTQMYGSEYKST